MAGSVSSNRPADAAGGPGGGHSDGSRAARAPRRGPGGTPSRGVQPGRGAGHQASLWLSTPWIAILLVTGVFHLYRGVPVDALVFLSAGAVLAIDTAVRHARGRRPGRGAVELRADRTLPRWFWAAVAAAVGALSLAVVVLAPASSTGIPAVVGLVGAAMLLVAWPDPPRPPGRPAPRVRRAAYWWAGVVFFLCIWELGTYFIDRFSPGGEARFPPLTDLLQPLFDSDSSRWFMTALWLVACGTLLRVVRRP